LIQVSFHFFNILAHATGTKLVLKQFEENPGLIDAIRALALEYPTAFQNLFFSDGSTSNYLKIFINGRLIDKDELGTLLNDGDEILLFPAAAGG
jgi:MoaD family protein